MISYLDSLVKTGIETIEATMRKKRILSAGIVTRMEDIQDCRNASGLDNSWGVQFSCGGRIRSGQDVFWTISELLVSRRSGQMNGAKQLNKRWKFSR